VTNEQARKRVLQLGEPENRVFFFGSPSIDNLLSTQLLSKDAITDYLKINLLDMVLLVTFHPLTMSRDSGQEHLNSLLNSLNKVQSNFNCSIIFTKANSDNGGHLFNTMIQNFVSEREECHLFSSLGQVMYWSIMKISGAVIGNSSSGIYEAPYLKIPTVDIGPRQEGRLAPNSVLHCTGKESEITATIFKALKQRPLEAEMFYGNGDSTRKIVDKIKELLAFDDLAVKSFVDRNFAP
jgi:UDP-hydrolysing UDP-N-acetyl-D-glucosamine 2-epimerase